MIGDVRKILKDFNTDWKILNQNIKSHRVYLTKSGALENYSESSRDTVLVTVHSKGRYTGESMFKVVDLKEVKQQTKDAIYAASLLKNKKYTLVSKGTLPKLSLKENVKNPKQELFKIVRSLRSEFRKCKGVKLNGLEVFFDLVESEFVNSKGLKLNAKHTKLYSEAVITSRSGRREQEFLGISNLRRLKDFDVKSFVKENCRIAVDTLKAKRGKSFEGAVVLRGQALEEFWSPSNDKNPLVAHCSAKLKRSKSSRYSLNKDILKNVKGDKLTIHSNALVNYNTGSYYFDVDGVVGKKVNLIKNNKFKNYLATKQYADYLKVKPTGPCGVVEVDCGKKGLRELYKGTVFEIVSFSWFAPNEVSGDFATEVRLGYLVENGKRIPVKGVVFTGNVFELFKDALLSKEKVVGSGYIGPKVVRFNNSVISGH